MVVYQASASSCLLSWSSPFTSALDEIMVPERGQKLMPHQHVGIGNLRLQELLNRLSYPRRVGVVQQDQPPGRQQRPAPTQFVRDGVIRVKSVNEIGRAH